LAPSFALIEEVPLTLSLPLCLEKELFLDMSDFSNPSHDFRGFIMELTGGLQESKAKETAKPEKDRQKKVEEVQTLAQTLETSAGNNSIEFEDILFYVCLPDFNNFKEPPHNEVRRLFRWLERRKVKTIRSLDIPDSTTHPMCDVLVEGAILNKFEINKLVWRKLDINLDILTRSHHADNFTEITLYSSGNWSVLYHWVSDEGLVKFKGVGCIPSSRSSFWCFFLSSPLLFYVHSFTFIPTFYFFSLYFVPKECNTSLTQREIASKGDHYHRSAQPVKCRCSTALTLCPFPSIVEESLKIMLSGRGSSQVP
jgi:hypothetical protein